MLGLAECLPRLVEEDRVGEVLRVIFGSGGGGDRLTAFRSGPFSLWSHCGHLGFWISVNHSLHSGYP